MKLETERLILRNLKESDFEDYWSIATQPNVGPRCGWAPPTDKKDIYDWFVDEAVKRPLLFAVELKENHKLIGTISITSNKQHYQKWSDHFENSKALGVWIGQDYWNRGFVAEVTCEVIKYCFEILKVEEVFAANLEPNIGSQKVQEKVGMKFVGKIPNYKTWYETGKPCDLIVHKITKHDWQKLQEEKYNK